MKTEGGFSMSPKKMLSPKPAGAIGKAGKLTGKRYAKSYYEEQMDMHRKIQKDEDSWEKAKKQWKQGKGTKQGVA
jgi:hypothetical protein